MSAARTAGGRRRRGRGWTRWALAVASLAVAGLLGWTVVTLPARPIELADRVAAELGASGVAHPVTAVLLNFRSYDTLLEVAVLVLAAAAAWSLARPAAPVEAGEETAARSPDGPSPRPASGRRDVAPAAGGEPVLSALIRLVVPLVVLTAAYLAWAGAYAPGGAFQAGALLAGAGVLLVLAGRLSLGPARASVRAAVAVGLAVFVLVGGAALAAGGEFLEYPPGTAYASILVIEAAITVSTAAILVALFVKLAERAPGASTAGSPPRGADASAEGRSP